MKIKLIFTFFIVLFLFVTGCSVNNTKRTVILDSGSKLRVQVPYDYNIDKLSGYIVVLNKNSQGWEVDNVKLYDPSIYKWKKSRGGSAEKSKYDYILENNFDITSEQEVILIDQKAKIIYPFFEQFSVLSTKYSTWLGKNNYVSGTKYNSDSYNPTKSSFTYMANSIGGKYDIDTEEISIAVRTSNAIGYINKKIRHENAEKQKEMLAKKKSCEDKVSSISKYINDFPVAIVINDRSGYTDNFKDLISSKIKIDKLKCKDSLDDALITYIPVFKNYHGKFSINANPVIIKGIRLKNKSKVEIPVEIKGIYPPNYIKDYNYEIANNDINLTISQISNLNDSTVSFDFFASNKTKSFVRIKAVAFGVEGRINTRTDNLWTLPPDTKSDLLIMNFSGMDNHLKIFNKFYNKNEARKKIVNFTVSIEYMVGDQLKTLNRNFDIKLSEIIDRDLGLS